ncbi:hypothetical protein ENSA7_47740 [Enhygromyxa salina]|uniref:Uncharacterized protein n=1 Tax=Enhygromyxa salina TaxID=215803 RepID=A0A2S9YJ64_9BACT|nr:hypothetical protein ENSA7_47740 [Enhygromyxa salina]
MLAAARAAISLESRRQVRLGPFLTRSEAEAVSGILRGRVDNGRSGPRCAWRREFKLVVALGAAAAVDNLPAERLGCPAMGTGVGCMDPFDAVEQMFDAWRTFRAER